MVVHLPWNARLGAGPVCSELVKEWADPSSSRLFRPKNMGVLEELFYDVAGPRQVLHSQRARLLVPAGNIAAIAARTSEIFDLSIESYEQLAPDCMAIVRNYQWEEIAEKTVKRYPCIC